MSRCDALDVLQETFAYLLRKSPGFCLTASVTTLLHPVVKNTSLAILRRKRRRQTGTAARAEIPAALRIPCGTVKSRMHNALQTLRQDDRARRYFED